jgi:hypothetical protein
MSCGMVRQVWQGAVRCSTEWLVKAGVTRLGNARFGAARSGKAGEAAYGRARYGWVW